MIWTPPSARTRCPGLAPGLAGSGATDEPLSTFRGCPAPLSKYSKTTLLKGWTSRMEDTPRGVESVDLVDLMRGFAERYRNESAVALDLLIDSAQLRAPDRVCREIFQIYREALNNIKKHAKASHVVVKLSQDDSRLVLVVDDNGEGFS